LHASKRSNFRSRTSDRPRDCTGFDDFDCSLTRTVADQDNEIFFTITRCLIGKTENCALFIEGL
jgi:hypothetical protein